VGKLWTDKAWEDYLYWQTRDKKTLKKLNQIIKDVERNPYEGIGHPEPLKKGVLVCAAQAKQGNATTGTTPRYEVLARKCL
jgi:toxin YoeB